AVSDGLPIADQRLTDKNAVVDIRAAYPQTGDAAIDADLRETINRITANFRKEANAAHEAKDTPYTLAVSYKIARNDAKMFDVIFYDEWDFHGAHPNLEIVTANYLRSGSWRVYLPELFDGERGLKRISEFATADLDKRLLVRDGYSDKDWIQRGAGPHWDNFQAFVLTPNALEIQFPPYQVAAYADGPQYARVPLAKLRDVLRFNPRTPVASFDCTRAGSANERAICSDVTLARLDREVTETWASELRNENDPERKKKLKASQITWLAARDKTCSGTSRLSCLLSFYRARLQQLDE
ncbi:MAG TPA: DUF3298 domain-containing protein, partial [Rhizomicrobium sp.]|nr:DUF3298 domain-containing protein [Rhizomicrobium sp.]